MSMYMDWQASGAHRDGTKLTGEEVRELVSLNENDWSEVLWEPDTWLLADFSTTSFGAYTRTVEALTEFAKRHPDIGLEFQYRYENSWCPNSMVISRGKLRHRTGHVYFTYDDEEVTA